MFWECGELDPLVRMGTAARRDPFRRGRASAFLFLPKRCGPPASRKLASVGSAGAWRPLSRRGRRTSFHFWSPVPPDGSEACHEHAERICAEPDARCSLQLQLLAVSLD